MGNDTEFARHLRRNQTEAERPLWSRLRNRSAGGKFRSQFGTRRAACEASRRCLIAGGVKALLLAAAATASAQDDAEAVPLVTYQSWFDRSGLTLRDVDTIASEIESREFHNPDSYGSTYPNLQTFTLQVKPGDDDGEAAVSHLRDQLIELGLAPASNDPGQLGDCLGSGFLQLRAFETSVFRRPPPAPPEPSSTVLLQYMNIPSIECIPEDVR